MSMSKDPLIPRIERAIHELTGPHMRPDRVRVSPKTHYDLRVEHAESFAYTAMPYNTLMTPSGTPLYVDSTVPDGIARIEVDIA